MNENKNRMDKTDSLGLYIHIPFCIKKCLYCDFLSATGTKQQRSAYAESVVCEINETKMMENFIVDTIYFGGGTPTVMESDLLECMIQAIYRNFNLGEQLEFSVECNPGTVTREKLKCLWENGVNRISFGLQSTNDKELKEIGRIHTYEEFLQCYSWAREIGFKNINVDIMSGIPKQTPESFQTTCERVLALEPEHISSYCLIVEPNTPFYERYREDPPMSEEIDLKIYENTKKIMKRANFYRYEISNYAKRGYECKHNLKYWSQEDYLGIGIGATSMIGNLRWKNTEKLSTYCKHIFDCCEKEELSKKEQMEEYVIFGLRKMDGISLMDFEMKFGRELMHVFHQPITKYIKMGMIQIHHDKMFFTNRGQDVSNRILAEFV